MVDEDFEDLEGGSIMDGVKELHNHIKAISNAGRTIYRSVKPIIDGVSKASKASRRRRGLYGGNLEYNHNKLILM